MEINKKYHIDNFFVGELYLYTNFANFISNSYNPTQQNKISTFSKTGAINFQPDILRRYIDWEKGREYTGFLTIFYKEGNKYICLHDGITYTINGNNFIENLIPLKDLLPKISSKINQTISIPNAIELFDILFKDNEEELYNKDKYHISEYYIGDLELKEIYHREILPDTKYTYINLPHHIMLDKSKLSITSFEDENYNNIIYRCLFLKQELELYNLNNHQYYNINRNNFHTITNFQEYIQESEDITLPEILCIPKALKLFKKVI